MNAKEKAEGKDYFGPNITVRRVIVGFDADTERVGLAAFDARTGEYQGHRALPLLASWAFIEELIERHGKAALLVRVEWPTRSSVMGKLEALRRNAKLSARQRQTAEFNIIYSSGRVHQVAAAFVAKLEAEGIEYEKVMADNRMNYQTNKLIRGLSPEGLLSASRQWLASGHWRLFYTKLPAEHVYYLTGQRLTNSEAIDALALTLPELLLRKFTK